MLVADFRNARVGDRVKRLDGVDGIIETINIHSGEFSVDCSNGDSVIRINENGFTEHGICPVWFYYFEGQFPTIEACKRPLPEIEVDDKVLVYQHGEWVNAYFSEFRGSYIATFLDGKTEWTNGIEAGRANNSFWKTADGKYDSGNLEEIE